jgi:hypothetical protein
VPGTGRGPQRPGSSGHVLVPGTGRGPKRPGPCGHVWVPGTGRGPRGQGSGRHDWCQAPDVARGGWFLADYFEQDRAMRGLLEAQFVRGQDVGCCFGGSGLVSGVDFCEEHALVDSVAPFCVADDADCVVD